MKKTQWSIVILAIAGLAMGCNKSSTADGGKPAGDTNSSSSSVTQQLENAREAVTNAWQKAKETTTNAWGNLEESLQSGMDYGYDKRTDYLANAGV